MDAEELAKISRNNISVRRSPGRPKSPICPESPEKSLIKAGRIAHNNKEEEEEEEKTTILATVVYDTCL